MSNTDCLQGVVAYNLQYANRKQYKTENSLANFLSTLNPEESFKELNMVRPFLLMDYLLRPQNVSPQEGASGAVRPRERPHRHTLGSSSAQAQAQVKNPEFRRVSAGVRCHWLSVMVTIPRCTPRPGQRTCGCGARLIIYGLILRPPTDI